MWGKGVRYGKGELRSVEKKREHFFKDGIVEEKQENRKRSRKSVRAREYLLPKKKQKGG
jgi:hypothetical protein